MRGYTHALSGAAAWLALTSTSIYATGHQPPTIALTGAAITAGAALLPDIDHPQATIAHSLPALTIGRRHHTLIPSPTQALAHRIAKASGGHRHATHSLIAITAATATAALLAWPTWTIQTRPTALAAGVVTVLLIAFAVRGLGLYRTAATQLGARGSLLRSVIGSSVGPWLLALGATAAALRFVPGPWSWFAPAVGVGALIHVVGDGLTVEGVPWLWPWNPAPPQWCPQIMRHFWQANGYFRLPLLGHTTSMRERFLATILGLYTLYLTCHEVAAAINLTQIAALLR